MLGKAVGYLGKKWLNLRSRLLWNWRAVKEIKLVTVLITRGGETEMGRGANDLCQFQKDCQKKQNHNMKVSKQRRYFGGGQKVEQIRARPVLNIGRHCCLWHLQSPPLALLLCLLCIMETVSTMECPIMATPPVGRGDCKFKIGKYLN